MWVYSGLALAMIIAFVPIVSERFSVRGEIAVFWRGLVPVFLCVPGMIAFPPPENVEFYLITPCIGLFVYFIDSKIMTAASRFGASTASRLIPLTMWMSFIAWLYFDPDQFNFFKSHPENAGLVLGLMIFIGILTYRMKHQEISMAAIRFLLPALVLFPVVDVLSKWSLEYSTSIEQAVIWYAFMLGITISAISLARIIIGNTVVSDIKLLFKKQSMLPGVVIGLVFFFAGILKSIAMYGSPNPAYVAAIMELNLVFILLLEVFYLKKRPHDVIGTLLIFISVVGLIFLSEFDFSFISSNF